VINKREPGGSGALVNSRAGLPPQELEMVMIGYLMSLFMGLMVGAAYGLVHVRSPAPPIIALVGLFGMVLGQHAVDIAKRRSASPGQTSIQRSLER
jgi:XapX domain-containing protein